MLSSHSGTDVVGTTTESPSSIGSGPSQSTPYKFLSCMHDDKCKHTGVLAVTSPELLLNYDPSLSCSSRPCKLLYMLYVLLSPHPHSVSMPFAKKQNVDHKKYVVPEQIYHPLVDGTQKSKADVELHCKQLTVDVNSKQLRIHASRC